MLLISLFLKSIETVFSLESLIPQVSDHISKLCRSIWTAFIKLGIDTPVRQKAVSSANSPILNFVLVRRSLQH